MSESHRLCLCDIKVLITFVYARYEAGFDKLVLIVFVALKEGDCALRV